MCSPSSVQMLRLVHRWGCTVLSSVELFLQLQEWKQSSFLVPLITLFGGLWCFRSLTASHVFHDLCILSNKIIYGILSHKFCTSSVWRSTTFILPTINIQHEQQTPMHEKHLVPLSCHQHNSQIWSYHFHRTSLSSTFLISVKSDLEDLCCNSEPLQKLNMT